MNKTRMVALDTSTNKSGCSLFIDGELKDYRLLDMSSVKDTNKRINEMAKALMGLLREWNPAIVYIEIPQGHLNIRLTQMLSELLGIVRGHCLTNDIYYEEMNPSVWRKYVGLPQGKKKRAELKVMSVEFVKNTYGIDVNDDVADSICIGTAMIKKFKGETGL